MGIRLEGQAAQGFDGMVYALKSTFRIAGGNNANMTLNMAVVADKIDISGQGTISIPYNLEIAPSTHSLRLTE